MMNLSSNVSVHLLSVAVLKEEVDLNCSKPSTHSHSIVKELFSDFETCMLHKLGHLHSFELHLGHSSVLVHL